MSRDLESSVISLHAYHEELVTKRTERRKYQYHEKNIRNQLEGSNQIDVALLAEMFLAFFLRRFPVLSCFPPFIVKYNL